MNNRVRGVVFTLALIAFTLGPAAADVTTCFGDGNCPSGDSCGEGTSHGLDVACISKRKAISPASICFHKKSAGTLLGRCRSSVLADEAKPASNSVRGSLER
jgi:hypothetical protein